MDFGNSGLNGSVGDRCKHICKHNIKGRNDTVEHYEPYTFFTLGLICFRAGHYHIIERTESFICAILAVLLQGISGAWISPFEIALAHASNS